MITLTHSMVHRHIDDREFTLTAIDDIIDRGKLRDWLELRDAAMGNLDIAAKILQVVDAHADDDNIRYDFWGKFLTSKNIWAIIYYGIIGTLPHGAMMG